MLIGITGKAGTGKDTAADYLVRSFGFRKYNLADPLKAMLRAIGVDPITREEKEAPHPVLGVSPRLMMQELGTAWMRERVNPNGWLILAGWHMQNNENANFVIPDVRFDNEAEWLREQGGILLHLTRKETQAVRQHVSEAGIARANNDYEILNNGSISELYRWLNETVACGI